MNKQFEILVVGRANGDIVIDTDMYKPDFIDRGVELLSTNENGEKFRIRTDSTPSKENDKVTSLDDLEQVIGKLNHMFTWGGGAVNSTLTAASMRTISPNLAVTILTPSKTYLLHIGEVMDLSDHLKKLNINNVFMNFTNLQYNIILPGENKLIVRNKPNGEEDFKLTREHKGTINQYISPSDGILINALNDPDMTSFIVQSVHYSNQEMYKEHNAHKDENIERLVHQADYMAQQDHTKMLTVLTHTKSMPRSTLVNEVIPYTGIIANQEDILKIFFGEEEERSIQNDEEKRMRYTIQAMSQMRYGIPTSKGVMRRIIDSYNNIYITMGKKGHLVAIKDEVQHLCVKESIIEEVNKDIPKNKSSTSGAGDAFAAAMIHQEVIGEAMNTTLSAAAANSAVYKYLGVDRIVHSSEIDNKGIYSLREYNTDKDLLRDKKIY